MNKLLIKNGFVVSENTVLDILIVGSKISEISKKIEATDATIIDANGLDIYSGFVDMHCHLREPGQEYKEDIASGTRSAAMGGFTSVACMPNTTPIIDNQTVARFVIEKAKSQGVIKVFPVGAISKGLKGEQLSEMGDLKKAGCVAVSDDGKPVNSAAFMKKAMLYSNMFNMPVLSHCEDMDLADEGTMNEGYMSTVLGLRGIPSAAEDLMVSREIILSEYTGVRVHICHVSTASAVQMIREAKARGVKVTAETCPHYFTLTEKACDGFNTLAKMNPPLRTQKDVEAIIEGIKDGTIDAIATDHAPHHSDEKRCEFAYALNGIVGFETAYSLSNHYLVKTGKITKKRLMECLSTNPSKILGLNSDGLSIGASADISIVDSSKIHTVTIEDFLSKSKNSPFDGFELVGKVEYTIVDGKIIVSNGRINE
ncbi:MAG: dihydroorotase [Bacillota bacterium]